MARLSMGQVKLLGACANSQRRMKGDDRVINYIRTVFFDLYKTAQAWFCTDNFGLIKALDNRYYRLHTILRSKYNVYFSILFACLLY